MGVIEQQGKTAQLTAVAGAPSTLREGIVRTIEPSGVVGIEMTTGRAGFGEVSVPSWYKPELGDRVLIGELNGDPASPIVVAPRAGNLTPSGWEPGDLKWSARDSCGDQWLGPCEGQQVSASEYPALAEVLGESGGMITLPDGRDRVLMGASADRPLGSTGGEAEVTLTTGEMPAHSHGGSTGTGTTGTGVTGEGTTSTESATHTHNANWLVSGTVIPNTGGGLTRGTQTEKTSANLTTHTHKVPKLSVPGLSVPKLSISSEGKGEAHNNLQPYVAENLFIHV